MKKKKRKIDSFKNWLLARDSSSRISTYPKYNSFLESESPIKRSRPDVMSILQSITGGKEFYKLKNILDYGLAIDSYDSRITMWINKQDIRDELRKFTESLNVKFPEYYIRINLVDSVAETTITEPPGERYKNIEVLIPSSFEDRKIVQESKKTLNYWWKNCYPQSEPIGKFFSWWMENYLSKQEKYGNFLKSFESAVVEWMRVCDIEDAKKIYLDLISNAGDENIIRRSTENGNKEIIDHVNQGVKEFNIQIEDLVKGASVIRRFGII